jgi:S-DNA-T family DNA segregation ATPase FtsK/SpoIIIE
MITFYDTLEGARHLADGRFGVDFIKHGEEVTVRYFTQSRRVSLPPSSCPETFRPRMFYQAFPKRAACFPFSFSKVIDIEKMARIPGNVWIQFLARKRDERWRELVMEQYDAYLTGVPNPSANRWLRRVQEWAAEKIMDVSGWAEGGVVIPAAEQKEQEDGYQASIRIAVQEERRTRMPLVRFAESLLSNLSDMNEYEIVSAGKGLLTYMEERNFCPEDKRSFLLCTSEIKAFFPVVEKEESQLAEPLLLDAPVEIDPAIDPAPRKVVEIKAERVQEEKSDAEIEQTKRKLEKAMRKIGFLHEQRLDVSDVTKGPTMQQVTIRIPKGVSYNALAKQIKNLQAELGVEEISITQGKQPGTAALLFRRDAREIVWLEPLIESEEFRAYAKKNDLAFIAGVDIAGKPIYESLVRLKHIISAGTTGGGKTEFLIALLYCLLSVHSPDDMYIYGIDPKRIALSLFRPFSHVKGILTDMDEAVELLQSLTDEMDRRYQLMEEAGVESIQEYCEETGEKIPYIVIVIDEYADLSMTNETVEFFIIRLGQLARQAGIHVVLATQRPAADILTSKIKTNLLSRFCFLCASPGDYQTVFGKQMSPALMGKGDGLCVREGIPGMTRFQAPLLAGSSKEKKGKLEALRSKWMQQEDDSEEKLEQLAAYIEQTGETRIREIQKFLGVRTALAQDMMQRLVTKGILLPPSEKNPRYRLTNSENKMT